MKYRTRTLYTDKQKSEMWDRWQRGSPYLASQAFIVLQPHPVLTRLRGMNFVRFSFLRPTWRQTATVQISCNVCHKGL